MYKKPPRPVSDAAMLLLLRRLLRDAVTFCAFEEVRELTTAQNRRRYQRSVWEREELLHAKSYSQIENQVLICVSDINETSYTDYS
jgi:hypothetical protein